MALLDFTYGFVNKNSLGRVHQAYIIIIIPCVKSIQILCKQTGDQWLIGIVNSFHQTISILQNVKIVSNLKNSILTKTYH